MEEVLDSVLWRPKITVGIRLIYFSLLLTFAQRTDTAEFYICFSAYANEKVYHAEEREYYYPKIGRINFLSEGDFSRTSMIRISQILDKIPKCLISCLLSMSRGIPAEKYLEIIRTELRIAYRSSRPSDLLSIDHALLIRTLLSNLDSLIDLSTHYRIEEFLLLLRSQFLTNISIVYEFNRFYSEFGLEQLASYNSGGFTLESSPAKVAKLIADSKHNCDGNPQARFEFLISSAEIILPNYDIE